jgi:hypothetical protein
MNLRLTARALGIAAGLVALPAMGAVAAPSAQAASGPVITVAECDSYSYGAYCWVEWSGGTAPYTVQWTPQQGWLSSTPTTTTTSGNAAYTGNGCIPDDGVEIKVTVTDANGLSASTETGTRCSA